MTDSQNIPSYQDLVEWTRGLPPFKNSFQNKHTRICPKKFILQSFPPNYYDFLSNL